MNVMDIMKVTTYQHWRLETDADGIAWATLDKLGETTNSLSVAVMDELCLPRRTLNEKMAKYGLSRAEYT